MNRLITCCLTAISITAFSISEASGFQTVEQSETKPVHADRAVIPAPLGIVEKDGAFTLPDRALKFHIKCKGVDDEGLGEYLKTFPMKMQAAAKAGDADVTINIVTGTPGRQKAVKDNKNEEGKSVGGKWENGCEGYTLTITQKGIKIEAESAAGAFYAIQSLRQLTCDGEAGALQCCTITDEPRFPYRGMHFDVSRHFRSKEFLLKQIDAMALLKMNKMHLHLTDGAGWRIEIEKYPRLTEFAAWRPYRKWSDWGENGARYCEQGTAGAYGGFYTKDDIREIIGYARDRHIEVIPEIEMPGHSEEVLAAYPELSCNGKAYSGSDFCPGKEATFTFLEDVLSEVIELFPSEYIHIGGDEAAKTCWKDCPDCLKRMQEEGIEDVDGLQSYLIHRIEEFVNSKGKKIIGWDEILQGGLAPNATVMSWRGTEGGIKAAQMGHDVIMTPGAYCYLDHSQDAPFREPVSIGGYLPLEKTYSYDPSEGFDSEMSGHLLGLQANLWTEYITEDSHAEYMYYPRAFAIAETGWSSPEKKDFEDFRSRAAGLCGLFGKLGYETFDLAGEYGERKESKVPLRHKATGKKVTYAIPYRMQYKAAGDATLTDGVAGGWTYGDGKWQGFMSDIDVTVDLGEIQPVNYIGATFMQSAGAWVYMPVRVDFYVSEDGADFELAGSAYCDIPENAPELLFKQYSIVCERNARFVRVHAVKNAKAGSWLFTDEIVVN